MTQGDLAAKLQMMGLSMDRLSICRLEKGHRFVSDFELVALAEALNVSVLLLLYGEASLPKLEGRGSRIAEDYE